MAIQITNAQELYNIRNDLTADYELASDIDFTGTAWESGWEPIGVDELNKFTGTFNGNGYTIKNLYIVGNDILDNFGLFGWAENAEFKNVKFYNCTIDEGVDRPYNLGFLCGRVSQNIIIDNILVQESTFNLVGDGAFMGMVIGGGWNNNSDIYLTFTDVHARNCKFDNPLSSYNTTYIGGLIGAFDEYDMTNSSILIDNCSFINESEEYYIDAGDYQVAGIIAGLDGNFDNITINNCKVQTTIFVDSEGYGAGGIVGIIYSDKTTIDNNVSTIENCTFEGTIKVKGQSLHTANNNIFSAGGIIATQGGTIVKKCQVRGTLLLGQWGGGIAGYCEKGYNSILDCSFEGDFVGTYFAGGIAGSIENSCTIKRSWANINNWIIRFIPGYYRWAIGGLIGYSSFWRPTEEQKTLAFESRAFVIEDSYVRVANLEYYFADTRDTSDSIEDMGCIIGYVDGGSSTYKNLYSDINLLKIDVEGEVDPGDLFHWGKFGSVHLNGYYDYEYNDIITNNIYINTDNLPAEVDYFVLYSERTPLPDLEYIYDNDKFYEWEGIYGRTTDEMTLPYASDTYLNFDWGNIWFSYPDKNDNFPVLVEYVVIDNKVYFLEAPTVKNEGLKANIVTVKSPSAEHTAVMRGISGDDYINRIVDIDEGGLETCRVVAEKLLEVWGKQNKSITGKIPLRQDLNFKEKILVVIPQDDFVKRLQLQKVSHDILRQKTTITCGDLILSDNELLARILAEL